MRIYWHRRCTAKLWPRFVLRNDGQGVATLAATWLWRTWQWRMA